VGIGGRRRFSKGLAMVFYTSLGTVLVCFIFVNCKVGDELDGFICVFLADRNSNFFSIQINHG
jgi:hypothetical protein